MRKFKTFSIALLGFMLLGSNCEGPLNEASQNPVVHQINQVDSKSEQSASSFTKVDKSIPSVQAQRGSGNTFEPGGEPLKSPMPSHNLPGNPLSKIGFEGLSGQWGREGNSDGDELSSRLFGGQGSGGGTAYGDEAMSGKYKEDADQNWSPAAIAATTDIGVSVFQAIPTFFEVAQELGQEAEYRKHYYVPYYVENGRTPEEKERFIAEQKQDLKDWFHQTLKKTLEGVAENFRSVRETVASFRDTWKEDVEYIREASETSRKFTEEHKRAFEERQRLKREEEERVEQGGYYQEEIGRWTKKLQGALFESQDIEKAIKEIDLTQKILKNSKNPLAYQQVQEVLDLFLDNQGLIRKWSQTNPIIQNTVLQIPKENAQYGKIIREDINRVLMAYAFNGGGQDTNLNTRLEYALELLLQTDKELAKAILLKSGKTPGNEKLSQQHEILGKRFWNRSIKLYNFTIHAPRAQSYAPRELPSLIKEEFHIEGIEATTFEGSEILLVSEYLAQYPRIFEDEVLRFHAAAALHQAKVHAHTGDIHAFSEEIDHAWSVVDYAKGLAEGIVDFAQDTVSGWAQFMSHPIDSLEALYDTVINYEQTYEVIWKQIQEVADSYDEMSEYEKGRLHARMASEILATFVPIGGVKNLGKAMRLGINFENVIKETMPLLREQGSIWTGTRRTAFVKNAYRRWKEHETQFPSFHNAKQYIEGARNFIENPPLGTLIKIRQNGDKVFFHSESNVFIVCDAKNMPRTMFKPDPKIHGKVTNLEYFNAQ